MGASCARRSRTSLNAMSSLGSFMTAEENAQQEEPLASTTTPYFSESPSSPKSPSSPTTPQPRQKIQRSLSRMSTRILLADTAGRSPEEGYDIRSDAVGVGGFGIVRIGEKKGCGRKSAIKEVKKGNAKMIKTLQNEVEINLDMDHPHIVKLYDVYEDSACAHLAFELCSGGEILEVIMERGKFGEKDAAVVAHQVLQAVTYLHSRSVCHRDLKLENLLLLEDKGVPLQENTVKLIDFGLSKRFTPGRPEMTTKAGSALYVAPEVLSATTPYTEICDVWSVGVILYILLSGAPPFSGDTNAQILKSLLRGETKFPEKHWRHVMPRARGQVEALMTRDPAARPTAGAALHSTWMQRVGHHDADGPAEHPEAFFEHLQQFSALNSFSQIAKHLVAHRVNQHEVKSLRAAFGKMDKNDDGVLSLEEMLEGCESAGIKDRDEMEEVFNRIDTDGSGHVDYTEFMAAAMDQRMFCHQELCQEAFEVFDQDHNGEITVDELREVLENDGFAAKKMGKDTLREILKKVDANGDQKIDFQEFVSMLTSS